LKELKSYTIDELEQLSGTRRRTISYYIGQGLLPSIGRKGPGTRYPALFVDRLNFISRFKELQEQGKLPTSTLEETAKWIRALSEEQIAEDGRSNKRLINLYAETFPEDVGGELAGLDAGAPDISADLDVSMFVDEMSDDGLKDFPRMLVSSSKRRDMHVQRLQEEPDGFRDEFAEELIQADEQPQVDELVDSIRAITDSLEAQRGMNEEMQHNSRELQQRSADEMRVMQQMLDEMRMLRQEFGREMAELRESVAELCKESASGRPVRRGEDVLESRARIWAKRNGVPSYRLIIARLTNNPVYDGPGQWAAEIYTKTVPVGEEIVVLFEPEPEGDNMRGRLEACTINAEELMAQLPVLMKTAPRGRIELEFSRGPKGMFQIDNCPGVYTGRFKPMVRRPLRERPV